MKNERLLTPAEVAARLAVSRKTVLELLRKRKLRGLKIGIQWRVREQNLEEYLEAAKPLE